MDAELCPGRSGTAASHCDHAGTAFSDTRGTTVEHICCFCGRRRDETVSTIDVEARIPGRQQHGPHAPNAPKARFQFRGG